MDAKTESRGSAVARRSRRILAHWRPALLLLATLPMAFAAEFEIVEPRGETEALQVTLTRAPGRFAEKVVRDEGYTRVGEARPRLDARRAEPALLPEPEASASARSEATPPRSERRSEAAAEVVPVIPVIPVIPVEPVVPVVPVVPVIAAPVAVAPPEAAPAPLSAPPTPVVSTDERPYLWEEPEGAAAPAMEVAGEVPVEFWPGEPADDRPSPDAPAAPAPLSPPEPEEAALAPVAEPAFEPPMRMETAIRDERVLGVEAQQQAEANTALPRADAEEPLLKLGPGDAVLVSVFGRPEFTTTTYVGNDGRITVPLAGPVAVAGLSPADAARRVAVALREGQFLVNPQVTITLSQYRSQTVSVLGEVKAPGRFPIETRTTVFDLLAQAGGVLETGSDVVYLIRTENAKTVRHPVDLKALTSATPGAAPRFTLRGGDSIFVPRAEQYYVYGEVRSPNRYRLEPGTTVVQAISRSGGLTPRGSENRIEIKRKKSDGKYETIEADLTDAVQADDVIRVKERIF